MGLWILLTAIVMLFGGLSSAYIVLRGVPDWQNIAIPSLVWINTFVLIASSVTIEFSRAAIRANRAEKMKLWVAATGILGFVFLVGQLVVWRQLISAGVYLPSTLHSSFFYILTGLHGIHLVGGIIGLTWLHAQAFKNRLTSSSHEPLKLCATYWHFMDLLWVYLAILLALA
jgi:cytochrome c oxidase subunit 3